MNLNIFKLLFCLISISLMMSCATEQKEIAKAIDPANMDQNVKPGTDFYQYANGTWVENNPLPPEYVQYGAFTELREKNREQLKKLVLDATEAEDAVPGSIKEKIGHFYFSGMDTARIEKLGIGALKKELEAIESIESVEMLQKVMAHMQLHGVSPLFYVYSAPDQDNSEFVIAQMWQGGLGLPDVDYYTGDDERSVDIRKEYIKHVANMLTLTGLDKSSSKQDARTIMKMETRLAKASMTRLERRDPHKTHNKMDVAGLQELSPGINWDIYFNQLGLKGPGELNVGQPEFWKELGLMINDIPIEDWKKFLYWKEINRTANYLSSDFVQADFDFYNAYLSGQKEMKPRWKRVLSATSGSLGEAIGQLYVAEYFPPEAKERMVDLVANLKIALSARIMNLDWMSDMTKKEAIEKLKVMRVKVGYPDKWIDYSSLKVTEGSYLTNIQHARKFDFNREMAKVGKPVDKEEWVMTPQTVNAGYVPSMNEIIFPAGILQAPFFFMDADDAVNYGAIGVVIGHEMTHGFDDKGRLYDKEGNLADWWTEGDATRFEEKTKVLVDQFNNFAILDTLHVNEKLTLGENIADLGGLNVSFDGMMMALNDLETENIDGFSPEQRFFLSYAQLWKQNITDKELMNRLKEDVHSPGIARVNGAVVNMDQFYMAFDVHENDPLYVAQEERAKIW